MQDLFWLLNQNKIEAQQTDGVQEINDGMMQVNFA